MIRDVPIGHMRLYSHMRPGLLAGDYSVELDQDFASTARPVETVVKHMTVTAPRFGLAGTEIHSVFPPNNSVGPFHNQLPHIALKRRTLPWERTGDTDADGNRKPWLALVILSDGEANFLRNVSVKDVLPSELHDDVSDDAVCDAVEVTESTVAKVFPGRDEFDFLLHVRQVNVNDTEQAGNDEDGFMAVVMANRLPQQGTNYGAYLISVENRFTDLPDVVEPGVDTVGPRTVYDAIASDVLIDASYSKGTANARMDFTASNQPKTKGTVGVATSDAIARAATAGRARSVTETRPSGWHGTDTAGPTYDLRATEGVEAASVSTGAGAGATATQFSATTAAGAATAHSTMTVLNDMNLAMLEESPVLVRFPVLAHWQFTCTEGFDFRELMINLDVGMIGSQPKAGASANPPQVTAAGQVLIDNLTRGGERVKSWYRSPFTPRQVQRRRRDTPFHSADQARSLGGPIGTSDFAFADGDSLEELGEAAAFEIGRMLALADPSFLQELLRWRRDGFRSLKTSSLQSATGIADIVSAVDLELGIGRTMVRDLYVQLAKGQDAGLGPLIDPNGGLQLREDDPDLIAAGFRTPIDRVRSALGVNGDLTTPGLVPGTRPTHEVSSFDDLVKQGSKELGDLQRDLDNTVSGIVDGAQPRNLRRGDG